MDNKQSRSTVNRLSQAVSRLFVRKQPEQSVPEGVIAVPPEGEKAWASDTFFGSRGAPFEPWNPDILIHNKGADIYWKMLRDDQVKAAYQFVVGTIISRSYRFQVPEGADPVQERIAQFFAWMMESKLRGTPQMLFRNVLSSKATGYSVTEMVFGLVAWEGVQHWALVAAKLRPFASFFWTLDAFGNVTALRQAQGSTSANLDPRKFIVHVTRPEVDPIFGESDLRSAYRHWWSKDNLLKFWDIYLERLAGGMVTAQPTETALQPPELAHMKSVLSNLSAQAGILLPKGVEFQVHLPPATDAFERAVADRNMAITRAMLMPALLGLAPEGRIGARAQAETQEDSFLRLMGLEGNQLADTLNEQLFRQLAWWNFGTDVFPRLTFDPFTDAQKRATVEAWRGALKDGTVHQLEQDEGRVRDLLGFDPLPDDVDYPDPFKPKAQEPILQGGIPEKTPKEANASGEERRGREDARAEMSVHSPVSYSQPVWELRFDARDAEQRLDSGESAMASAIADAMGTIGDAVKKALADVARGAGKGSDLEALAAKLDTAIPPVDRRALNKAIQDGMMMGYEHGRTLAVTEIGRAAAAAPDGGERVRVAAAMSAKRASMVGPSPVNFALGMGMEAVERYLQAKAFEITGVLSQTVLDAAKQVLLNGIRDEKTLAEMVKQLIVLLADVLPERDSAGRRVNIPARVQTIARTNLADAFNQARLSVFTDPSLGDFVQALEYFAILDSVTTEFCRYMDGRIYRMNDPVWRSVYPPNHFNCRSTTIPVTVLDTDWEASGPLPASVQPAKGFG